MKRHAYRNKAPYSTLHHRHCSHPRERNLIGFELNKEYYDKVCKRIKMEQAQLTLF